MQLFRVSSALLLLLVTVGSSSGAALRKIRVTADGVNLRAAPRTSSETVAQVTKGSSLSVISEDEEWIRIVPPEAAELWVFGGLVRDGVVAGSHVKVRCGPGISYTAVGEVNRGDHVHERGRFNDWLRISPPAGCGLWISRRYVVNSGRTTSSASSNEKTVSAVEKARSASVRKPTFREVSAVAVPRRVAVEPPEDSAKRAASEPSRATVPTSAPAPRRADSSLVERRGVIKRAGILTRRHAPYRLVQRDATGRFITVCGLEGEEAGLRKFMDRSVRVSGTEVMPQGSRWPVLRVERIIAR